MVSYVTFKSHVGMEPMMVYQLTPEKVAAVWPWPGSDVDFSEVVGAINRFEFDATHFFWEHRLRGSALLIEWVDNDTVLVHLHGFGGRVLTLFSCANARKNLDYEREQALRQMKLFLELIREWCRLQDVLRNTSERGYPIHAALDDFERGVTYV